MIIPAHELNYIMGSEALNKHAKIVVNRAVNKRLRIKTHRPTHLTSLGRMFKKGIECEDESIAVFNKLFGKNLVKNTEKRQNQYIKGVCDLIDGDTIIDIKTAWSVNSTPPIATNGNCTPICGYLTNPKPVQRPSLLIPPSICLWTKTEAYIK